MARFSFRGLVGRIVEAVKDAFTAPPEPSEPEPRERPARSHERDMQDAWREETRQRAGRSYQRHRDLFDSIPGIDDEDDDERDYLWRSYIENMVNGRHRRNDPSNPFWSDIGLDPRDFDWDEFRTAMGYKGRR